VPDIVAYLQISALGTVCLPDIEVKGKVRILI